MTAVVAEFFATKQYRIGPRPNPESEVRIRDVVRRAIEEEKPIPILIASAAVKVPIGESLDVAELSMLRVLCALHLRVGKHYLPGISARIRLEDLTEYTISSEVPEVEQHVKNYIHSMCELVKALGYDNFIKLVPESSLTTPLLFNAHVQRYIGEFEDHLQGNSPLHLQQLGWGGGVSLAMREWMYDRYDKLYPGTPHGGSVQRTILASYLSSILARRNLGAMGEDKSFKGRLEVSFAPALPDAPPVSTRVYYRTVPLAQSSMHMSPWNAKGHLRIGERGVHSIALGRWGEEYTKGQLEIEGNGTSISIRADYRLED
jgi:hypothetical protein